MTEKKDDVCKGFWNMCSCASCRNKDTELEDELASGTRSKEEVMTEAKLHLLTKLRAIEWERNREKWLPIETAPTDELILLCDEYGNRWTDCYDVPYIANRWVSPPTRWQPVPAPPKEKP